MVINVLVSQILVSKLVTAKYSIDLATVAILFDFCLVTAKAQIPLCRLCDKVADFVANTNHESPQHKSCPDFHDLCLQLCCRL